MTIRFALAVCLLLAVAQAQAIEVENVKPSTSKKANGREPIARHATLSLGGGLVTSTEDLTGYFTGGAITVWGDSNYLSLRGEHMRTQFDADQSLSGNCCYANINEQSLSLGFPLTDSRVLWMGLGVARVQRTKGEAQDPNFVSAGGVIEFVLVTPLRSAIGGDFRLFGNINGKQNFIGVSTMLRFGR